MHLLLVLDLEQGLLDPRLGWDLDLCLVQALGLDFRLRTERGVLLGLGLLYP